MRVVAAASTDDEPLSAGAADETPPSAGQADETPPLAKTAEGGSPAQRRVMLPSEDLTRPGLTPWQVLGVTADPRADPPTIAEVKAAYRARMKVYHPDVYDGDGDGEEMARRIVAAYRAVAEGGIASATTTVWDGISEIFPWARDDADPFDQPEGPADAVFVNEFTCRGKGACPAYCCCVGRSPESFAWAKDTNAARFDGPTWTDLARRQTQSDADDAETAAAAAYNLNLAVGQCPVMAIHWVTPKQRRRLDGIVADAAEGLTDPREGADAVYALLAKAAFENGPP